MPNQDGLCKGGYLQRTDDPNITGFPSQIAKQFAYPDAERYEGESRNPCDLSNLGSEFQRRQRIIYNHGYSELSAIKANTGTVTFPRPVYAPKPEADGNSFTQNVVATITIPQGFIGKAIRFKAVLNKPEWAEFVQVGIFKRGTELEEVLLKPTGFRQDWFEICVAVKDGVKIELCAAITNLVDANDVLITNMEVVTDNVVVYGFIEVLCVDNQVATKRS